LKVEVSIPEDHVESAIAALHEAGAGRIGNYQRCTTFWRVSGTWEPLRGAEPFMGAVGQVSRDEECRLEAICDEHQASAVLAAVRRVHPYEEPVINFIPLFDIPS
jgi:hypothetical protein